MLHDQGGSAALETAVAVEKYKKSILLQLASSARWPLPEGARPGWHRPDAGLPSRALLQFLLVTSISGMPSNFFHGLMSKTARQAMERITVKRNKSQKVFTCHSQSAT
jgi:hypothetical protein